MTSYTLPLLVVVVATGLVAGCASGAGGPADRPVPDLGGRCDVPLSYDIAFDRFDETAQQIAHGTGCLIKVEDPIIADVSPNAVTGTMTPRQALARAVAGTPVAIVGNTPDIIVVAPR